MSRSFDKLATVTFCSFRSAGIDITTGLSYAPVAVIVSGSCTPLDPLNTEVIEQYGLEFFEGVQTMARGGLDIKEGDLFQTSCSGTKMSIRAVGDWYWSPENSDTVHLIIQQRK